MTKTTIKKVLAEASVVAGKLAYKAAHDTITTEDTTGYLTKSKIYFSTLFITKDNVRMVISFNDKKLGAVIDADIEFVFSDIEYGDELLKSNVGLWGLRVQCEEFNTKIVDFKFTIAAEFEKKFLKQLKISC